MSVLTFKEITKKDARIEDLYNKARSYKYSKGESDLDAWYSIFKPQVVNLVGWFAEEQQVIELCTRDAYEIVYKTVLNALP